MSDPLKLTQDLVQSKQDLEGGTSAENATGLVATRVGYLTTWNQNCGLATYARYMLSSFPEGDYIVLAEDTPAITRKDELFVRRCWKRNSTDFSLLEEIIGREEIKLLHLNCHYRFFTQPQFGEFLTKLRARGVRVVGLIHNPFTLDAQQQALLSNVDATIVHTPENALEVIANGATPESTYVVPHGVQLAEAADRDAIRKRLGIPEYDKVLVSFGFVQPHKGMEALIESVQHLHQAGSKVRGYIVGGVMPDDPHSVQYLQSLRTIVKSLGLNDLIQFIDGFVDDRTVGEYLCIADLVLMNYQSQYYEASGACALALGAGALVATSSAPTFHSFGNAVWHITGGFPAQLSCAILLDHQTLREEILSSARDYCQRNSWHEVGQKIYAIYEKLGRLPMQTRKEMVVKTMDTQTQTTSHSALKVLFRNRANALTQRGGDTVVMQKLAEGLRARGVQVEIDLECTRDASRFDLVHLFNFATPDLTRMQAENAHAAGTPFVVTTLNEDIPSFHDQSIRVADVLKEYCLLYTSPSPRD